MYVALHIQCYIWYQNLLKENWYILLERYLILSYSSLTIMESEIAPQGLDAIDNNIAHLRAVEKTLFSKRMESQKEINKATIILDNLYTQKANRSKVASLEHSLKELRLAHKKINSDISELNRKIKLGEPKSIPQNRKNCFQNW